MNPTLRYAIERLANHGDHSATLTLDRDSVQLLSRLLGSTEGLRKRLERRDMVDALLVASDLLGIFDEVDDHILG